MLALELVQMKVDPETRRRVKILAAQQGIDMWQYVANLVDREWKEQQQAIDRLVRKTDR